MNKDLESNQNYIYRIIALDDGGLISSDEPSRIYLTSYDRRMLFRPLIQLSRQEEGLQVKLMDNIPGESYRIQIFRAVGDQKFISFRYLQDENQFVDFVELEKLPEKVGYKARILYSDGARSRVGEATIYE